MRIIELTMQDFDNFAENHPLRNYCQTSYYAKVMGEKGYNYDYIGYKDDSNNLVAGGLVLTKKTSSGKYAYAPKGFLIDYYNTELVRMFVKDVKDFYNKKGCCFIKINPEIIIGEIQKTNYTPKYNQNVNIIDTIKDMGFKRRREIEPLDLVFPRLNAYINLKNYDFTKLNASFRDKIKMASNKGLSLELATSKEADILYNFVKNHTNEPINTFRNILNIYGEESELLLVKIDYEEFLITAKKFYDRELEHNNYCNTLIQEDSSEKNLEEKMQSDKDLLKFKNDIISATEGLRKNKYKFIGAAIVIKFKNRISLVESGFDPIYDHLSPSYYLYSALIERYKNDYDFLDLNGIASNFFPNTKYSKYNEEKLAFNPTIYEFIGEFDLIINDFAFKRAQSKGLLSSEFIPSHKF